MGRTTIDTIRPVLLFLALLLQSLAAEAKFTDRYNERNLLIIVCDWDLPPYEFLNDMGQPSGYHVDLLDVILDKLDIPHQFVMKETPQAIATFEQRKADLFAAPSSLFKGKECYLSSSILSYYRIKVATRSDAPRLKLISDSIDIKHLVLRRKGHLARQLEQFSTIRYKISYRAPMEALGGIVSGKYDYFIWGEEPMKWKIKELNLQEELRIDDANMPVQEIHLAGYDKELINSIDDQFARMEQNGELPLLYDKWFRPEHPHDNTSPVALYITIAAVILLLVLVLIHKLVTNNVKRMLQKSFDQTRLMNMTLDMGGYMVSEYDPKSNSFKNLRGELMDESSTLRRAIDSIHEDDQPIIKERIKEINSGVTDSSDIQLRRLVTQDGVSKWQYLTGNCIKEQDKDDHIAYLLVSKDITNEIEEKEKNDELFIKYSKSFDVLLTAMSFYNQDGKLLSINQRMKQVIGINPENQKFFYETSLFDAPLFKNVLYYGMRDVVHACQHMYYPDINLDKYLEYRIRPILAETGEIRYYTVTVRDISDERNIYHEQQSIARQLNVTNAETQKFEEQLHYMLSNSNMFIWNCNYQNSTIQISRSLRKVEFTMTFDEYLAGISSEDRADATSFLKDAYKRVQDINMIRHFRRSPLSKRESWYAISGLPVFDKKGLMTSHVGVIRDVSQLMRSQEELRLETIRAEESGKQKASFLANMTHEIRTPLNAIVGFSDLLHMTDNPNDRKEYINIIRQNCNLLLRLIDDILETSTMNERPQSIKPEDMDFAKFFDEVCQIVAQRVQAPDIEFIIDNPFSTLKACSDKERIQQVLTNFVTNSVKYTHQGHIKVGYRSETREVNGTETDGIYIYCEDTGAGIPKEKQGCVFDRFVKLNDYVQGTGLGLSICKSIAERCGGQIGLISEGEGKGSTFWFWIPRYLTSSNLS